VGRRTSGLTVFRRRYVALLSALRELMPPTRVLLLGVLPIADHYPNPANPQRQLVNSTWPSIHTEVCTHQGSQRGILKKFGFSSIRALPPGGSWPPNRLP
jgi:hypothetical protein